MNDRTFDPAFWASAIGVLTTLNRPTYQNDYKSGTRGWWVDQQRAHPLHPVVDMILKEHRCAPTDWHLLLLQWPHIATTDTTRLAYTRDEKKGQAEQQTLTSIGKYVARHWPHVADHVRAQWCATYSPDTFELRDTPEGIISGIELGPQSCMKSAYGTIPFDSADHQTMVAWLRDDSQEEPPWESHPYICYSPVHDWRMAVRINKGQPDIVMGRALTNGKVFVRSYMRGASDASMSQTDDMLDAWLINTHGMSKVSKWPEGLEMRKVDYPHSRRHTNFMAPYIDGDRRTVRIVDSSTLRIEDADSDSTFYECDRTDGTADEIEPENYRECEDCGAGMGEDDGNCVGIDEDRCVCESCISDYTRAAYGNDRREAYFPNDDTVSVKGAYYCTDDLPDEVVCCEDGEYRMRDDCVEIDGDFYPEEECVYCEDTEDYNLIADSWQCMATNKWYSDVSENVEVDGLIYHPDRAPNEAQQALFETT